eukprot:m.138494 g.138494  ORF g.138494 m.138494 type:complete len:368 (+) comp16631_c0_seq1:575-1678(+)
MSLLPARLSSRGVTAVAVASAAAGLLLLLYRQRRRFMPVKPRKVLEGEVEGRFDVKESVGKGAFSEVFRVVEKHSKSILALKVVDKSLLHQNGETVLHEVDILTKLDHPNILKVVDTFETDTKIYIVLEMLSGGELFDQICDRGTYTEKDASTLLKEILVALKYLHDSGIIHRDIKPENLIYKAKVPDSPLVITDFGLAIPLDPTKPLNSPCGTPGYVAPEVLMRKEYNEKADMWSLGIIAYILLCGYPPFFDEDDRKVMQLTLKGDYEFDSPAWDPISASAKDFISHLLQTDPAARFSATQALAHPWISGTTASSVDLHEIVATNIKKNFARSMWKKAINMQTAIKRMQKLTMARPAGAAASPAPQ